MFCLKIRRELISFKDASKVFHSLSALIKKSLLSVIPFSERKTEIVSSSSLLVLHEDNITSETVWQSQQECYTLHASPYQVTIIIRK